jgi:DNA-binding protein Fis
VKTNISDIQEYISLYEKMYSLCQKNGWGDPFSYARSREIYIAGLLNHHIGDTYSGADGYDENGEYEYKSTINKKINGAYNGISVQNTLEEQIEYIKKDKIGKYAKHYYARFEGAVVKELYEMDSKDVLDILLPKVIKEYNKKLTKKTKDPRIGVSMKHNEIYKYGRKII